MNSVQRLAIGSIFVGLAVLAIKVVAWQMTGSVALMSDALESTVNVATAVAALIAIRIAAAPADARHPYGHHKAELFAAILEGVMIIGAAALIIASAWSSLANPVPLNAPLFGLAVNVLASLINGLWCFVLIRAGRRHRSPALLADGRHLLTDVVSSIGVTVGVLLAMRTGWAILDPIMALLVAANILWSGWRVMTESLSGLLDEALPDGLMADLRHAIAQNSGGAMEAHDLRTRHAGAATFIDFHLVVRGDMSVADSHAICDRIEAAVKTLIPGSILTIHVEPDHKAKHSPLRPVTDA
jgi:cation diffusion facilitator family transporter